MTVTSGGLDAARAVADAVLYEGYLLYPYHARSDKNRVRFQWGVLGPQGAEADGAAEGPRLRTDVLVQGSSGHLEVTARFLQLQQRTVERADGHGYVEVEQLDLDGQLLLPWGEVAEHEVTTGPVPLERLLGRAQTTLIEIPGGVDIEPLVAADGTTLGRRVRRRWTLVATMTTTAEPVDLHGSLLRVRVELSNDASWTARGARDIALRQSLIGTHVVLHTPDAAFVSLLDPPERARAAAAACEHERVWPVLVGEPGRRDTMLASPIVLEDHPAIAPESPADLYDATEIDELLLLRVATMTDDEKREARATDPRAAAIVDQAEALPLDVMERLHGAVRTLRSIDDPAATAGLDAEPGESVPWWDPGADASVDPSHDTVAVDGVAIAAGSKVRLRPGRRADAQDLFLIGRVATVAAVYLDVDGATHVAVTVDDDPASDLHDWYGRYRYYAPEELEPLEGGEDA